MKLIKAYSLGEFSDLDYIFPEPKTKNVNQEVMEALRRKFIENGIDWENCDNA